jgi:tetraacyldisaccharide 4'-kinase
MGPLEFIYYLGYSYHKSRSLKNQQRLPRRVISVGNLTVGGTGKTPAVIALAEQAQKRGYLPCVLTRGYKGKSAGPCFVSRGEGPLLGTDEAGDEAVLMAEKLHGVPIVKGTDRYAAGIFALRELSSQPHFSTHTLLFILDDGFQHRRLWRDLDILLIDSTDPFGNRRLLPAGRLREPLRELGRADVVVLTKVPKDASGSSAVDADLTAEVKKFNPGAPIYLSDHRASGLTTLSGGTMPLAVLSGKAVLGVCGIGNPASFRETLRETGADVREFMAFADHHPYSSDDLQRIRAKAGECGADWIVTTEKDIMRLRNFGGIDTPVAVSIAFRVEESFYDRIFTEE